MKELQEYWLQYELLKTTLSIPIESNCIAYFCTHSCLISLSLILFVITIIISILGPWIENLFIEYFIGKPFSSFNGIVPLFVQWSDYHLHYRGSITSKSIKEKNEAELYLPFTSKIRKHVLYVVISQANYGLGFLARKYPNVLIFSAGGEGEVPIPLIKGELPYTEIDRSIFPKYDVSFLGSIDHGHRKKVLDNFIRLLDGTDYRYKMGPSKTWESEM